MAVDSEIRFYTMSGEPKFLRKELAVFIALATVLSWAVALIIILQMPSDFQKGDVKALEAWFGSWPMLFGLGPFIAAFVATLIYRGKSGLKELFKKVLTSRAALKWYLVALVLPIIPQWIGLILWNEQADNEIVFISLSAYLFSWLQMTVAATLYYISEELGWRGFMLPRVLTMHTWLKSGLLVGVIWSIWHYPLWLTSTWATTGSVADASLMVVANTIFATAISIVVTWIFRNTRGSILLAMLFHGSSQASLTRIYGMAGNAALLHSDFAITLAATWIAFVILILLMLRVNRKPDELV